MAIVYICKMCNGTGHVERKYWFMTKNVACRFCNGSGKKKYRKEKTG